MTIAPMTPDPTLPQPFIPATPRPAPSLSGQPIGPVRTFHFLRRMRANPLTAWTVDHYNDPVVSFAFLGRQNIAFYRPEDIQRCFVAGHANLTFHYMRQKILQPLTRDGLLTVEGEPWRRARALMTPVFNARRVRGFADSMAQVATAFADGLASRDEQTLALVPATTGLTLDILLATLFSDDAGLDRARFVRTVAGLSRLAGSPHPFDLLQLPEVVPRIRRPGLNRMLDDIRAQVRTLIAGRRDAKARPPGTDFLDLMIGAQDDDGDGLSDEEIVDNILTILLAGHETTALSLAWTLYLISQDHDVRSQIEAELDKAPLDDTSPADWEDILPYLCAVVKESLRLYPPAPYFNRVAIGPDRIGGFEIAPGTTLHMPVWALHRHRLHWQAPQEFRPERFLGVAGAAIAKYTYLPFGLGPRVCIGARFAQMELVIALAAVLTKVRLTHVGHTPPVPMMRVTLHPSTDIPVQVAAR